MLLWSTRMCFFFHPPIYEEVNVSPVSVSPCSHPPNPPSARFQESTRKKAGQKKKRNKKKASSPTPSVPDVTSNRFQALSEEEEEEDEEKDQVEMATTQQAPQTVLVVDALAISAQPDTMVEEKEEEEVQIPNSDPDSAY